MNSLKHKDTTRFRRTWYSLVFFLAVFSGSGAIAADTKSAANSNDQHSPSELSTQRTSKDNTSENLPTSISSVVIESPSHEQTINNPQEPIQIIIRAHPENGLPKGYVVNVYMDDELVSAGEGLELEMPVPHRGSHTVKVMVLNANGRVKARSKPITIFVKKPFIRKNTQ